MFKLLLSKNQQVFNADDNDGVNRLENNLDVDDRHLVIRPSYIIICTESMFPFDFNQL